MKRSFLIGVLIVSSLLVSSVYAGGTSEYLYNECNKLKKAPNEAKALMADVYCAGYIDGVVDGYRITSDTYPQAKFVCLPSVGLSNDTIIEIFNKWFEKNMKEKDLPARTGVLSALKAAYPCK